MTIALIAHDAKKELMVQFCIAYCGILSRHNLVATGTTGKTVSEATGLEIARYMSGSQGALKAALSKLLPESVVMKSTFYCFSVTRSHQSRASLMKMHFCAFAMFTTFP